MWATGGLDASQRYLNVSLLEDATRLQGPFERRKLYSEDFRGLLWGGTLPCVFVGPRSALGHSGWTSPNQRQLRWAALYSATMGEARHMHPSTR